GSLEVPEDTKMEIELLKSLAAYAATSDENYKKKQVEEQDIIRTVITTLAKTKTPEKYFEKQYLDDLKRADDENEKLRCACDQTASLTDASIRSLYEKIKG
ncbi:MAG: deoxyguanosinetriphosphate triphosphohydrolase, partial [Aeriscardovia sp.]|nr:deoxyguanosinetriphosphate triphosphohydrolase [Aeriscardovia sp.]